MCHAGAAFPARAVCDAPMLAAVPASLGRSPARGGCCQEDFARGGRLLPFTLHPTEWRGGEAGTSAPLVPGSMSSKLERASGWRSSDFGVKMISWWGGKRQSRAVSLAGNTPLRAKAGAPTCPPHPALPCPSTGAATRQWLLARLPERAPASSSTGVQQHRLSQAGFPLGKRLRCHRGPAHPTARADGRQPHRVICPGTSELPAERRRGLQPPQPAGASRQRVPLDPGHPPDPEHPEVPGPSRGRLPRLLPRGRNKPAPAPGPRLRRDAGLPCLGTEPGAELPALTGLRKGRRIWRRRTWKKLAGVEQFTTIQLQS